MLPRIHYLIRLATPLFRNMNTLFWCFLGYLIVFGTVACHWMALLQKYCTLPIPPVCRVLDSFFFFFHFDLLNHGLNMAKRKHNFLLTYFGFTPKKLVWDNQNVGEEAGLAATAQICAGLSSDSASTC